MTEFEYQKKLDEVIREMRAEREKIQKVIETISIELIEQNAKLQALELKIDSHEKAMSKAVANRLKADKIR